ncbi:energy transducer TonB [Phenylobacterium sp.]|uniref:energy transducer TonB n=1 Tax=Phenylobacterium sp. TaxID=1871053 RepID=UPI0039194A91
MRRAEVSPAALGSIALHAAIAAALMISWGSRDLKVGSVVPVTIVSNAPDLDTRPAVEGPQEQEALAETPVPEAPLTPESPAPQPTPAPPAPPTPQPKPAPPQPKPAPVPPAPAPKPTPAPKPAPPAPKAKETSQDFFASLEQSISSTQPKGGRPSPAPKGPSRPATSPTPRDTAGTGLAAGSALAGLADELQRRWNPNCDVEGGRDVLVRVTFNIGAGGQVVGAVKSEITRGPRDAVGQAAAERAERAVYAASPFRTLPRDFYGERVAVNFNAREACAR